MTKLLLDTHVWIWALQQPERLGARARRLLENPRNDVYLSPVSIWEAHHLALRKKLRHSGPFSQWLDRAWRALPVKEAAINFAVVQEAASLHLPQSDFGDLFLAATAAVFDFTLVTADAQLLECRAIKTVDAG